MARKDLAGILIEEKILPARDVERLQRSTSGRPLWLVLLEAELSTEEELFFLLAQRWQVATDAIIDKVDVPESARRVWTRDEAIAHGLLPIEIENNRATAIMVDPSDEESLKNFLARLKLSEARVLLGRRSLIERAIARTMTTDLDRTPQSGSKAPAETTAQVKVPLQGKIGRPQKQGTDPKIQAPRVRGKTEPKVQIDPELAEEMQRLPPRSLEPEALTPMPRVRRRRTSPEGVEQVRGAEAGKPFTLEDALRAEERLSRALLQAVEVLARELEARLTPADDDSGRIQLVAVEMSRLSRRVARKLGLDRRSADEIGAAAYLFAVDRKLRQVEARAADWFGDLGWSAANDEGLLPVLRALTANTAGFSRTSSAPPLGARIITVVDDYLQLGAASGEIDLGTVSQLLRASPAGAPVVDALLRVLESEKVTDPTPATTVTATSVLHPPAPDEKSTLETPAISPLPINEEKTVRKAAPTAPQTPVSRVRREKE